MFGLVLELHFLECLESESIASCSKISSGKASIFSLSKEISDSEGLRWWLQTLKG